MKFVKKVLMFVVRLALMMLSAVFQELNAAQRRSEKITQGRIRRRHW